MLKVTKTVRFNAAHLLADHPGRCRNLHGHTYRADVTVAQGADAAGDMVVDFGELKRACEETILDRFDHAFVYGKPDGVEGEIAAVLERHALRTVRLEGRPTAENLAKHFFRALKPRVPGIVSVTVWESPDSRAEYAE